eukprot:TRINITY_DN1509_c1_g1_i1.p1 TRINITY_DN1509_c1_g1~~TRINITY_DN1509_c1_g1_i1.p1  ORF type:complete len:266 (-),score=47.25 TRINITY_DN1509_c1_g1_i1:225-962(-)
MAMTLQQSTPDRKSKRPSGSHRTKMCWFYPRGKCADGEACTFAHAQSEFRANQKGNSSIVCRHWAKGFCRAGEDCRFAHSNNPSEPVVSASEQGMVAVPLVKPVDDADLIDNSTIADDVRSDRSTPTSSSSTPRSPLLSNGKDGQKNEAAGLSTTPSRGSAPGARKQHSVDWFAMSHEDEDEEALEEESKYIFGSFSPKSDVQWMIPSVQLEDGYSLTVTNTFLDFKEDRPSSSSSKKRSASASP